MNIEVIWPTPDIPLLYSDGYFPIWVRTDQMITDMTVICSPQRIPQLRLAAQRIEVGFGGNPDHFLWLFLVWLPDLPQLLNDEHAPEYGEGEGEGAGAEAPDAENEVVNVNFTIIIQWVRRDGLKGTFESSFIVQYRILQLNVTDIKWAPSNTDITQWKSNFTPNGDARSGARITSAMFDHGGVKATCLVPAHVAGSIWTAAFGNLTTVGSPYILVVYDNGVEAARSINLTVTA